MYLFLEEIFFFFFEAQKVIHVSCHQHEKNTQNERGKFKNLLNTCQPIDQYNSYIKTINPLSDI